MSAADAQLHRDIGALEAEVQHLKEQVGEMKQKIDVMHDAIVSAKGGWKMLLAVGSAGAAVGTLMTKILGAVWR